MELRGNWNYPTAIRFGAGRIAELPDACRSLGMGRPLLVTDPGHAVLPMVARAVALCRKAGLHCAVFSDVQPNPVETDPKAKEKIHDVVGLYLNPPANAVVLSVDERTQIQALNRTQPILPLRPGLPARQTHDYQRNGLTSLYAALEVASGRVVGKCSERHTGADSLRFLTVLTRSYYKRDLHVILDNSSTHKTPEIQAWLAAHPWVHFHFTPTGASWLNMVEAWFGILTRKSVRRGSLDTVGALIKHIRRYIDRWNDNPTPLVWTKEPAAIIKKALRRAH